MDNFIDVLPKDLQLNPFSETYKNALIISGDEKRNNAMCVDNIVLGKILEKEVVGINIKPLRYTKEFLDFYPTFSVNYFDSKYDDDVNFIGTNSGRNFNKITKSNLNVSSFRGTPFFQEATTVIFCKKIFHEELREHSFSNREIINKFYILKDFHTFYISEIQKIIKSKSSLE